MLSNNNTDYLTYFFHLQVENSHVFQFMKELTQ